jgi:hypothetical protein
MSNRNPQPQTFVEMVLLLLEARFPWLGSDQQVSGAEAVEQLNDLHDTLKRARTAARRRRGRDQNQ